MGESYEGGRRWFRCSAPVLGLLAVMVAGGCSGGGEDEDAGSELTYRITIESIVPDDAVPDNAVPDDAVPDNAVPDDAVSDEAVSEPLTVEVDGRNDLGQASASLLAEGVCPETATTEERVDVDIVLTTREQYTRIDGCGPDLESWRRVSNPILLTLLYPSRIDLGDPKSALERRYGIVFDDELRGSAPTDCTRLGKPFCESMRLSNVDPAQFAEAGADQFVIDVDLDDAGRVSIIRQEWLTEAGEPVVINGQLGVTFRVTDYGLALDIDVPDIDGSA